MIFAVTLGALVLAVGGCVCVVWADRGGPRWVRGVAAVTLAAGELARRPGKGGGSRNQGDADSPGD
ncbi:hypothetical protein ACF09C_15930 [Streptomyces sp. NPDC014870]|uniref:hypothetical protein n=1 Tax=Streptomyces sp. NPDC014870 TaxID=3364925 RepID=UPI0036FE9C7D